MSAPERPTLIAPSALFQSKSGERGSFEHWARKISLAVSQSGRPRQMGLSSLPGFSSEGSRRSGRLVAATTQSPPRMFAQSKHVSSCATSLSVTLCESEEWPLRGARESTSSKNSTQGRLPAASSNTARRFFSLQPTYLLSSYGPLTETKAMPHSWAMHLASRVLPVPGGPQNSMPVRGRTCLENNSGCSSGSIIVSIIYCLAYCSPPISLQPTEVMLLFLDFSSFSCQRPFTVLCFQASCQTSRQPRLLADTANLATSSAEPVTPLNSNRFEYNSYSQCLEKGYSFNSVSPSKTG